MDFNLSEHCNDDGTFINPANLRTLAGTEHAETKCFDDMKDFPGLVKFAAETKSAYGKKLENVIQKPAADASDEEKAAYRASLKTELGAVKSGAEYEVTRPDLPKGMYYDEALEGKVRDLLAKAGVPKDEGKAIFDGFNNHQLARHKALAEAETRQIEADDNQLRADWPGDDMVVKPRLAFAAMQALGAEAFPKLWNGWKEADGSQIEGLEARLKKAAIFDSPGDLAKWRECGVDTSMLRLYSVIGERMKVGNVLTGDGLGKPAVMVGGKEISEAQQAEVEAVNANTTWV